MMMMIALKFQFILASLHLCSDMQEIKPSTYATVVDKRSILFEVLQFLSVYLKTTKNTSPSIY